MKRVALFIGLALAVYFTSYVAVRHFNHLSGTQLVPDAAGVYHSQALSDTRIHIPGEGFQRLPMQVLYGGYYPIGHIDQALTGRRYNCTDYRDIVL